MGGTNANMTFQKKEKKCRRYEYHLMGMWRPASSVPLSRTMALSDEKEMLSIHSIHTH